MTRLCLAVFLLSAASLARADDIGAGSDFGLDAFNDYTDFARFSAAYGDVPTRIRFTEVPVDTLLTNQFADDGVFFTDGDDTVTADRMFVEDGIGVDADGRINILLSQPAVAIGAFFPGALRIDLFDGDGNEIYQSRDFAGSGFAGVVADTPFEAVALSDWADDSAFIDDLVIGLAVNCDVDNDGDSDFRDIVTFLLGCQAEPIPACDINGNGEFSTIDAILLYLRCR